MKFPVAVILAGGQGKRFTPLTIDKTLIPFLGKPLIQHTLEMLERSNLKEIVIATNSQNHEWISQYKSSLHIKTKKQPKPLGMADAVLHLEKEIHDSPCIIMNAGDIVDDSLIADLLQHTSASQIIAGIQMDSYFPGGYIQFNGNRIERIVEKPAPGTQPSTYVKLVFDYFKNPSRFLELLKNTSSQNDDHYEQALSKTLSENEVAFVAYQKYWSVIKHSYHVLDIMNLFLHNKILHYISPKASVSPNSVIEGNVYIDDGAHIHDYAVIKGPAYIGRNVMIGNHTLVRQSMIEEGSIIGYGSEIARSYIGPKCELHRNFIGDSILESEVNPSSGTTTANLRLDRAEISVKYADKTIPTSKTKLGAIIGKGVFSGINCSFMPGITIGAHAKIYPGTVVYKSVPAQAVVKPSEQVKLSR